MRPSTRHQRRLRKRPKSSSERSIFLSTVSYLATEIPSGASTHALRGRLAHCAQMVGLGARRGRPGRRGRAGKSLEVRDLAVGVYTEIPDVDAPLLACGEDRFNRVVPHSVDGKIAADVDELVEDDAGSLLLRIDPLVSVLVEPIRLEVRLELWTQAGPEFVRVVRLVGM